jgi:threonine dehydrogenase-like Zn-dependent dehydrogenase
MATIKAIAVNPAKPDGVHSIDLPMPQIDEVSDGRGVLVKVLQVGICGTDREIVAGQYGTPPEGSDFLVLGHENFGIVEQAGGNVSELKAGDYVMAMVRIPGKTLYDRLGMQDMTTSDVYYEHGISRVHGFLRQYYVEAAELLIRIPAGLKEIGVLLEPVSIIEKGLCQVSQIQTRLPVWKAARALVLGAGTIGLLATLLLRLGGVEVLTMALPEAPYLNSELVEGLGAHYRSTAKMSLFEAARSYGPFDLIFEATGYSPLVFKAMEVLAKNGVLVLCSVTGGKREISIPSDLINKSFVLGNRAMVGTVSANRRHLEAGVRSLALAQLEYPGWLPRLITRRIDGLTRYRDAFRPGGGDDIKRVVEMAKASQPVSEMQT